MFHMPSFEPTPKVSQQTIAGPAIRAPGLRALLARGAARFDVLLARGAASFDRVRWLLPIVSALSIAACQNDALPTGDAGALGMTPGAATPATSDASSPQQPATTTPPAPQEASVGAMPPNTPDGGTGQTGNVGQDAAAALDGASTDAAASAADATLPTGPLTGPFPPVTDFTKDGPLKSSTLEGTGPGGNYTIYMPTMLAANGAKNPIVGWMSGGGTTHTLYPLLPRLATHGFVVVCANVTPGIGEEVMLGKQIMDGIDWVLAENMKTGSMFFDKLDATKIASMGYSMGSLSTFTIANDPRLTTTVHISGGNMDAQRIANLHAPAAFICGIPGDASCGILDDTCDIAAANCDTDFAGAKTPVFYANFNGGHLGILLPPTEDQIGALATMWLRWKLMSDRSLDGKFLGDQCEVCKEPQWKKVQRKNL
jgi:hypothetical protein